MGMRGLCSVRFRLGWDDPVAGSHMGDILWPKTHRSYQGCRMPFGLLLGAAAPWLVARWADLTGTYYEALMVVALLNLLSGIMIFLAPPPKKR